MEVFKVNVVSLQTKKAKYWGGANVAEKESRNQELLVERMEAKHHVNFQEPLHKFQRARMTTEIVNLGVLWTIKMFNRFATLNV